MKPATFAVRTPRAAPFALHSHRRGKQSWAAWGIGGLMIAGLAGLGGCAEMQGVKSANLNRKLPEPDAEFMKRVERDPFPVASTVSASKASSQAKSKESQR